MTSYGILYKDFKAELMDEFKKIQIIYKKEYEEEVRERKFYKT